LVLEFLFYKQKISIGPEKLYPFNSLGQRKYALLSKTADFPFVMLTGEVDSFTAAQLKEGQYKNRRQNVFIIFRRVRQIVKEFVSMCFYDKK